MSTLYPHDERVQWIASLPKRASSSTAIIENQAGEVLVVKANYKSHWTFPGGVIDPDETPLLAACRETEEEVGIRIDPADLEFVSVASRKSDYAETYQFVFRMTSPLPEDAQITLQVSEIEDYMFVSRDEVLTDNRHYGQVIYHWAHGVQGYVEQSYGV